MIGRSSILGREPGWSIDEFKAVINTNPQADIPLGTWLVDKNFLYSMFIHNIFDYVDYNSGTVNFENSSFIELLELADIFKANNIYNRFVLILEKRQIMARASIGNFENYKYNRAMFGGEVIMKGFPVQNGHGHALIPYKNMAITEKCSDKESAWGFISSFLSDTFQRDFLELCLPVNKSTFEMKLAEAMDKRSGSYITYIPGYGNVYIEVRPLSIREAEMIKAVINDAFIVPEHEDIWNIISETASDYFNGKIDANEAVRIIQSRTSIYMSEQYS